MENRHKIINSTVEAKDSKTNGMKDVGMPVPVKRYSWSKFPENQRDVAPHSYRRHVLKDF